MSRCLLMLSSLLCLGADARSPGGSPWPGPVPAGAAVQLGPPLGADEDIDSFAWSADGRWLYSPNGTDGVLRWDSATGWPESTLATGQELYVHQLASDPRGRFLVALHNEELVRIALPSGTTSDPIPVDAHGGFLTQMAVSPDGTRVAVGRCATWATPPPPASSTSRHLSTVDSPDCSPNPPRCGSTDGSCRLPTTRTRWPGLTPVR